MQYLFATIISMSHNAMEDFAFNIALSTSTATLVTVSSDEKIGFGTLMVEVRYMIYRWLFPDLHRKVKLNVFWDFWKLRRGIRLGRDTYWSSIIPDGSRNFGDMGPLQVQLSSVAALMSVNH